MYYSSMILFPLANGIGSSATAGYTVIQQVFSITVIKDYVGCHSLFCILR